MFGSPCSKLSIPSEKNCCTSLNQGSCCDDAQPVLEGISNIVKFKNPKAPQWPRLALGKEWDEVLSSTFCICLSICLKKKCNIVNRAQFGYFILTRHLFLSCVWLGVPPRAVTNSKDMKRHEKTCLKKIRFCAQNLLIILD